MIKSWRRYSFGRSPFAQLKTLYYNLSKCFCWLTPATKTSYGNPPILSIIGRDTVQFLSTTSCKPAQVGFEKLQIMEKLPDGEGGRSWPSDYHVRPTFRSVDAQIEIKTRKTEVPSGFTKGRVP